MQTHLNDASEYQLINITDPELFSEVLGRIDTLRTKLFDFPYTILHDLNQVLAIKNPTVEDLLELASYFDYSPTEVESVESFEAGITKKLDVLSAVLEHLKSRRIMYSYLIYLIVLESQDNEITRGHKPACRSIAAKLEELDK